MVAPTTDLRKCIQTSRFPQLQSHSGVAIRLPITSHHIPQRSQSQWTIRPQSPTFKPTTTRTSTPPNAPPSNPTKTSVSEASSATSQTMNLPYQAPLTIPSTPMKPYSTPHLTTAPPKPLHNTLMMRSPCCFLSRATPVMDTSERHRSRIRHLKRARRFETPLLCKQCRWRPHHLIWPLPHHNNAINSPLPRATLAHRDPCAPITAQCALLLGLAQQRK